MAPYFVPLNLQPEWENKLEKTRAHELSQQQTCTFWLRKTQTLRTDCALTYTQNEQWNKFGDKEDTERINCTQMEITHGTKEICYDIVYEFSTIV